MNKENENFNYHVMKKDEIPELSQFLANIFCKHDPFLVFIDVKSKDLIKTIEDDLLNYLDDKSILVATSDKTMKIVGCYAGFKFSTYFKNPPNTTIVKEIIIPKNIKELKYEEKLYWLNLIDEALLIPKYIQRKENKEMDQTIFCDYFCVDENYFGTDLAKGVIHHFFKLQHENGIKYGYGSFFNPRAVKVISGYGEGIIFNEIKIKYNSEEKELLKTYLIGGSFNNSKFTSEIVKPKF